MPELRGRTARFLLLQAETDRAQVLPVVSPQGTLVVSSRWAGATGKKKLSGELAMHLGGVFLRASLRDLQRVVIRSLALYQRNRRRSVHWHDRTLPVPVFFFSNGAGHIKSTDRSSPQVTRSKCHRRIGSDTVTSAPDRPAPPVESSIVKMLRIMLVAVGVLSCQAGNWTKNWGGCTFFGETTLGTLERTGSCSTTGGGYLDLSNRSIKTLPANFSAGMFGMTSLSLSHNNISSLPRGLLDDATNLRYLDLQHNRLQALPGGILDAATNLQFLHLNDNAITMLREDMLARATKLEKLWLSRNELEALPNDFLADTTSLVLLDVSSNSKLSALPVLDATTDLRWVFADHTSLRTLPANLFAKTEQLEVLDLSSAKIESLPAGLLFGAKSLRQLNLDNNSMKTLPTKLFSNDTRKLKVLNLNRNNLTSVPDALLDSVDWEQLGISYNNPSLHYRYRSDGCEMSHDLDCALRGVGSGKNGSTAVAVCGSCTFWVDHVSSSLNKTGSCALDCKGSLYLERRGIYRISRGAFAGIPLVHRIYLSHNVLMDLDADTFDPNDNLNLQYLYLDGNPGAPFPCPNTLYRARGCLGIQPGEPGSALKENSYIV